VPVEELAVVDAPVIEVEGVDGADRVLGGDRVGNDRCGITKSVA
jgi:hypothetical protein